MKPEDYPLFITLPHLEGRVAREWSHKEADQYFDWMMTIMDFRIKTMLDFLEVTLNESPEEILEHIGEKMQTMLGHPAFQEYSDLGKDMSGDNKKGWILSARGYALAADIGLLFAQLMLQACNGRIKWTIIKKDKRDHDYHLPVLTGFRDGLYLDPIHISVVCAKGFFLGYPLAHAWKSVFCAWKWRCGEV